MPSVNPWLRRRVLAFGHRGSARLWPENTLQAFRGAVAAGATALELDVHATADGHVVVCHDATVDRTTDGSGAIAELPLERLRALNAGHRFVPGHGAEATAPDGPYPCRGVADDDLRVPTLDEVLAAFPGILLTMELKAGPPGASSLAEPLAALLERHGRGDDVIVSAADQPVIDDFRACAPTVPTGTTAEEITAFWSVRDLPVVAPGTRPPVALQVPVTYQGVTVVSEGFVADAHEAGLAVHAWTVNEPAEMERLVDMGVDGIMSDRPDLLVEVLGRRGVAPTA